MINFLSTQFFNIFTKIPFMKPLLFWLLLFVLLPWVGMGQVITTVAGNGIAGYSGDGGQATDARIGSSVGCAFDSHGNFYFTDGSHSVIRKINTLGVISTIAGTGVSGYNGDNIPATNGNLNVPLGIAFDSSDNLYIADDHNCRVRKVDIVNGLITTVAGNGTVGYSGDGGIATNAAFNGVQNICLDKAGNIFILDYGNFRIRKVSISGIVSTVAGNGVSGNNGDGGMATAANIEDMVGICVDASGNIYFAQQGLTVRKVSMLTGIITKIAGIDPEGAVATGDGGPAINAGLDPWSVAFDKMGNLYVSGYLYHDVRKIDYSGTIYTVAGTGIAGYSGDNGPATAAQLDIPIGIAFDSCGNLFITERDYHIRKVAFNPDCWKENVQSIVSLNTSSISPNPATTQITITAPNKIKEVSVWNMVGQRVWETSPQPSTLPAAPPSLEKREGVREVLRIDVSDLPAGVYFVVVCDEDGGRTVSKIIKQ
jgi:Secretion system C-terminal sorting domain/NHL repeat